MMTQSSDQPLDEWSEHGIQIIIVALVQCFRQSVPKIEGDFGQIVVWIADTCKQQIKCGEIAVFLQKQRRAVGNGKKEKGYDQ